MCTLYSMLVICGPIFAWIVLIRYDIHGSGSCPVDVEWMSECDFNPFKPEFTIVTFIHYKPRIAVAILDL